MAYALKSRFLSRSQSRLSILTLLKVDLDVKDNLDRFQKLVSTRWTFSISIGLDCRDPQGYNLPIRVIETEKIEKSLKNMNREIDMSEWHLSEDKMKVDFNQQK